VWPIRTPFSQDNPGVDDRAEQRLVKQLIPQAAVEALDKAILHGHAEGDVMPFKLLVNSVPLSLTMAAGLPRSAMMASNSRATHTPDKDVSAISARFAGTIVDDAQYGNTGRWSSGPRQKRPPHIGGHRQDHRGACPECPVVAGFYQPLEEIQGSRQPKPSEIRISATPRRFRIAGGN
jgi:hypothetical protein